MFDMTGVKEISITDFYRTLIELIPSIAKLEQNPNSVILNIDLLLREAQKSGLYCVFENVDDNVENEFDDIDCDENELMERIFKDYSMDQEVYFLQNANHGVLPVKCEFKALSAFIDELPMSIFAGSDVVVLVREKRMVTLFHHTGYFVHVYEQSDAGELLAVKAQGGSR